MANSPEAIRQRVIAQMKAARPVGQFVVSTIQNIPIVNFGNFPRDINLNNPLTQAQCNIELRDIKLQSRNNRRRGRYQQLSVVHSPEFLQRPRQGLKTATNEGFYRGKSTVTPKVFQPGTAKALPKIDFKRDLELLAQGALSPTQFKDLYADKKISFIEADAQQRPHTTAQAVRPSLGTVNRLA